MPVINGATQRSERDLMDCRDWVAKHKAPGSSADIEQLLERFYWDASDAGFNPWELVGYRAQPWVRIHRGSVYFPRWTRFDSWLTKHETIIIFAAGAIAVLSMYFAMIL